MYPLFFFSQFDPEEETNFKWTLIFQAPAGSMVIYLTHL